MNKEQSSALRNAVSARLSVLRNDAEQTIVPSVKTVIYLEACDLLGALPGSMATSLVEQYGQPGSWGSGRLSDLEFESGSAA